MDSPLKLFLDRQNKTLLTSDALATPAKLPPLFQLNVYDIQVKILELSYSAGLPTPVGLDYSGKSMRISLGSTPTGTIGGPTPVVQSTLTWSLDRFVGQLALNTDALAILIANSPSAPAYFEINVFDGLFQETLLQQQILVFAVVDEGAQTQPSPTETFYNTAASNARFVLRDGQPGDFIILRSPDGTKAIRVGCNDDGTPAIDQIAA